MVTITRMVWATNPTRPVIAPVAVEVTGLIPNFWKYRALVATRPAADGTAMLTNPIANCSTVVTPIGIGFGDTAATADASVKLVEAARINAINTRPQRASDNALAIVSNPTSASPPTIV